MNHGRGLGELPRAPFEIGGHHLTAVASDLIEAGAHRGLERTAVGRDQGEAGGGERDRGRSQQEQRDLVEQAHARL